MSWLHASERGMRGEQPGYEERACSLPRLLLCLTSPFPLSPTHGYHSTYAQCNHHYVTLRHIKLRLLLVLHWPTELAQLCSYCLSVNDTHFGACDKLKTIVAR